MARMFCTLKEAAERLRVDMDAVEALLGDGTLREFREGSHRLVREADVGALAAVRKRSVNAPQQPRLRVCAGQPAATRRPLPQASRSATDTKRPPDTGGAKAPPGRTTDPRWTPRTQPRRTPASRARARPPSVRPPRRRYTAEPTAREIQMSVQELSVRQWFWNGLIQDRFLAIAILFGMALLALSAAAAGVCLLAERL